VIRQVIEQAVSEATGLPFLVKHQFSLAGGSINAAFRIAGEHGCNYFLKLSDEQGLAMLEAEADGLRELSAAGTIRIPEPVCTGTAYARAFLVTEYINMAGEKAGSSRLLGEQLAGLHRTTAFRFGWWRDNTIGSTPQCNSQSDDWVDFYRSRRLQFQMDLACRNGFSGSLQSKGERLLADLDQFFDSYKPEPSLLHGDLWGGNHGFDEHGKPVIFDPAVYFGDREADLAMSELFGGFSSDFYAAYNEAWPLDSGYRVRKTLYNLYHILNHANLFGGGYAAQAESMIDRLLAEV